MVHGEAETSIEKLANTPTSLEKKALVFYFKTTLRFQENIFTNYLQKINF